MGSRFKYAMAINCMDGRVQGPVMQWMKDRFNVDYVDVITEAGPIKPISESKYGTLIDSFKRRVDISITKHGSRILAVVGHHDCAGNPVNKDEQIFQIKAAMKNMGEWGFDVKIVGLYVDEKWLVSEIK